MRYPFNQNEPGDTSRRQFLTTGVSVAGVGIAVSLAGSTLAMPAAAKEESAVSADKGKKIMDKIIAADGTQIYYKDWGKGQPIVFCHGWPLSSDSWEAQMFFLADKGFRCIAHDRRGHGRSSQPWDGNNMDTYADDLALVLDTLELTNVILVGFSTGGGEVARYIGRHGSKRVAKLVLIGAVPPQMLKSATNPNGVPMEVFDGMRKASLANRAQLYQDLAAGPFFGFNRPGATISQGLIDWFYVQGMQSGHKNTYDCIKAFSETNFTDDLKKINVPTLIIHGDDDQVVPLDISAKESVQLIKGAKLLIYPGAPHGLTDTHKDKLNDDLLAFAKN